MPQVPHQTRSRSSHGRRVRPTHDYDAYAEGLGSGVATAGQAALDEVPISPPAPVRTVAEFASTIRPVAIVEELPDLPNVDYPEFSYVVLTTDGLLYKNVADAWVQPVSGDEIEANSITAAQIAAGAIGTSELAVGARLTGEFANDDPSPGVFIDVTGILIQDGQLTIQDEFGSTVFTALGFSGSWEDYVRTNLFNGLFNANATTVSPSMGRTADVPYWTLAQTGSPAWDIEPGAVSLDIASGTTASIRSDRVHLGTANTWVCKWQERGGDLTLGKVNRRLRVFGYGQAVGGAENTLYDSGTAALSGDTFSDFVSDSFNIYPYVEILIELSHNTDDADYTLTRVAIELVPELAEGLVDGAIVSFDEIDVSYGGQIDHVDAADVIRQILPSGWVTTAFAEGWSPFMAGTTAANLAAVAAGLGGARAVPIRVREPMRARQWCIYNTDAASARSAEVRLFRDVGNANLEFVSGTDATFSFTPGAPARRTANMSTLPVNLEPGLYWAVIRNTSASQTFGLGFTAQTNAIDALMNLASTTAALGATIDVTGWTESSAVFNVAITGEVMNATHFGLV
jgi:hypothetical protein